MKAFVNSIICLIFPQASISQVSQFKKVENIQYGMVSGTALLMDAYVPERSNHKAILFIPGSAFGYVYEDYFADDDPLIPARQSQAMYARLLENHVAAKIVLSPNAGHAPLPDMTEVIGGFDLYLKLGDTVKR